MKLNKRQTLARKRIGKISIAIQTAIDETCESEDFKVSYSEINAALLEVLKQNNSVELHELWNKDTNNDYLLSKI